MKITIEERLQEEEDEIIIRCKELDESLLQLIRKLKSRNQKLPVIEKDTILMIDPRTIYYFESVDNKVFAYCKNSVYEIKQKLYEIEQDFEGGDFFRAAKATIINLSKVERLSPAFNSRLEATLLNGEKVIISRQYVSELRRRLGIY